MKKIKKFRHKKIILIILSVLLVSLIIALVTLFITNHINHNGTDATTPNNHTPTNSSVNQSGLPPSTIDKTNDTNSSGDTPTQSVPKKQAQITIIDSSQYGGIFEVRAYVDALEDGTCSYSFSKGGDNFVRQTPANSGATTTSCTTLDVNVSDFPSNGAWQLNISYLSNSGQISGSVNKTIEIK